MSVDDQYKKMKEPAPDSFPPFEEESWRKMELLLDKHLPQRPVKPFPYIAVFSCLILISLTTFLPAKQQYRAGETNRIVQSAEVAPEQAPIQKKTARQPSPESSSKNNPASTERTQPTTIVFKQEKPAKMTNPVLLPGEEEGNDSQSNPVAISDLPSEETTAVAIAFTGLPAERTNKNEFLVIGKKPVNTTSQITIAEPAVRKPFKNNFSLTVSTGLETPGTGFNQWGKLTPLIGIGVQYNFRNKLVLRTGISTATKIYTARDKDYNPTAGGWTNYYVFDKIEADCKIIEIPLSAAYRIANGKQGSMFLSLGSSSYIMRNEAYQYSYKNQYGNDTVATRAFNNNSLHLFSSVNLSVIAEKKINNRLSLMAEPMIKIPTQGIGVGNIRLFNAGVIVSARFTLK